MERQLSMSKVSWGPWQHGLFKKIMYICIKKPCWLQIKTDARKDLREYTKIYSLYSKIFSGICFNLKPTEFLYPFCMCCWLELWMNECCGMSLWGEYLMESPKNDADLLSERNLEPIYFDVYVHFTLFSPGGCCNSCAVATCTLQWHIE